MGVAIDFPTYHSPLIMSSFETQKFNTYTDHRGQLTVAEFEGLNPTFVPKRAFWIHHIPNETIRGEHANRSCCELVVAIAGSFRLWLTNGTKEVEYLLENPSEGVYIPPMVWCRLSHFSPDAICLCLADKAYDDSEYINDFSVFLEEKGIDKK